MKKSVIIIPTRLQAERLPNKPLLKIDNIPMIIHVMKRAKESGVGDVIIATPDHEISDLVEKNSGKAIITSKDHLTGTDRVCEVLNKLSSNIDIVINLQGDMPNLDPDDITKLDYLMKKDNFSIGTLASMILNKKEINNINIVKVETHEKLNYSTFSKAKDFFRKKESANLENIYHHIGIYGFKKKMLFKYAKLNRTKNETERNLEQMRALDNNIDINVALSKSYPLGVDTEEDFLSIKKSMEYKN